MDYVASLRVRLDAAALRVRAKSPTIVLTSALDPDAQRAIAPTLVGVVALPKPYGPRALRDAVLSATAPTGARSPMTSRQILEWLYARAVALWPVVSALLIVALRAALRRWIAMGERSPRVQGVIRLLRAVGLDPAKALSALAQIVTGRAPAARCRSRTRSRPVAVEGPRAHPARGSAAPHASAPSPSCSRWGSASRASARRSPGARR